MVKEMYGGASVVAVIVVGNGIGHLSLNPESGFSFFSKH